MRIYDILLSIVNKLKTLKSSISTLSTNISNVSSNLAKYLPLAGGKMTGNITWDNAEGRIRIGGKYALGGMSTTSGTYIVVGDTTGSGAPYDVELQSSDRIYLNIGSSNDTQIQFIKVSDPTYTAYFRPMNNGKVTNGTSSNRWYRLYAAVAESVSSDRRLKENISTPDKREEAFFDKLIPVQFTLKNDKRKKVHFGFIAQDVITAMEACGMDEKVYDFIEESEDGYYSLTYSEFIALNTAMIQRLKRDMAELKRTIGGGYAVARFLRGGAWYEAIHHFITNNSGNISIKNVSCNKGGQKRYSNDLLGPDRHYAKSKYANAEKSHVQQSVFKYSCHCTNSNFGSPRNAGNGCRSDEHNQNGIRRIFDKNEHYSNVRIVDSDRPRLTACLVGRCA